MLAASVDSSRVYKACNYVFLLSHDDIACIQ